MNYLKTFYVIVVCFFMIVSVAYATEAGDDLKAYCKDQWGNNYRMVEHCYNSQLDAFLKASPYFQKYVESIPGVGGKNTEEVIKEHPEAMIVLECYDKWSVDEFNTYNFRMVHHCITTQLAAYERMK